MRRSWRSVSWGRTGGARIVVETGLVAALLCLGVANIATRATWHEVEDGVLWVAGEQGVVAVEIARATAASIAGIRPGDVLLAIEGRPIDRPADVVGALHAGRRGTYLTYTVLRLGTREILNVVLTPVPRGQGALYYAVAAVGIFTLLVGISVRIRRPGDQATVHFLWLCAAFFGAFTFSFSGRLDRLDWVFYWADVIALLLLAPLFLHFALVFPERPHRWVRLTGWSVWPLMYLPAAVLGLTRAMAIARGGGAPRLFPFAVELLDRIEPLYLSVFMAVGWTVLVRALRKARSITVRRQLRWIVWGTALGAGPFAVGYALPYAFRVEPSLEMDLLAIPLGLVPLAFASAVVRYRLMDVEVIVKRGLVYAAATTAIAAIYVALWRLAGGVLFDDAHQHHAIIAMLALLVVVLLARPVKNVVQTTMDRAFYRDRYDYRRALVAFARDLNSDLNLGRLSERLVTRVMETLLVDRMALLIADEHSGELIAIRSAGFAGSVPPLPRDSMLWARLKTGHTVALDEPRTSRRVALEEIDRWRDLGIHYFVPCVSKDGTSASMALGRKDSGEPLSSEDLGLLAAVAGQVATALENGRLYGQLRQKADELERLRAFSDNILESLDVGLAVVDRDDRVVRWNHALERLSGVAREEALGRRLDEVFDAGLVDGLRAGASEGGATLYRVPLVPRGQPERRILVDAATVPLRGTATAPSGPAGTIVILDDITSRVRLEEQLQIAEKMASIGLLAAGVAHEVNTPLTGISSFTQMLLAQADPHDPKTEMLEKIERQTFRAAKIVNGLLNLSRSSASYPTDPGPVDLNAVISDVLSLLDHQFKVANVTMRRELSPTPPIVRGLEHKLQQVFLNLFLNARDAMPRGGWLSVATRTDGDRAVVEVADTGSGIPREHLSRIYDPFFTTKPSGQGTGLGLSITYGIVREHEGSIACDSTPGQGTRFTLALPLAAPLALTRAVH